MIEPKDITKMVQHIVRRDSGVQDSNIMHPMREWALGLFVVGLLVLGGVVFNISLYQTYHAALTAEVPVTQTVVPYKAALVAHAIADYRAERKVYESIIGASPVVVPNSTTTPNQVSTTTDIVPAQADSLPEPVPPTKDTGSKPQVPVPAL